MAAPGRETAQSGAAATLRPLQDAAAATAAEQAGAAPAAADARQQPRQPPRQPAEQLRQSPEPPKGTRAKKSRSQQARRQREAAQRGAADDSGESASTLSPRSASRGSTSSLSRTGGSVAASAAQPAGPTAAGSNAAASQQVAQPALAGTPVRRDRSRSNSKGRQRAGQEGGAVRRMPKLFPDAGEEQEAAAAPATAPAASVHLPSVPEQGPQATAAAPAAAPAAAGRGRALQSPPGSARARRQRPECSSSRNGEARPTLAQPVSEHDLLQRLQAAATAAGISQADLERLQEADRLAADLLGSVVEPRSAPPRQATSQAAPSSRRGSAGGGSVAAPATKAVAANSRRLSAVEDLPQQPMATVVWQGSADSSDLAAFEAEAAPAASAFALQQSPVRQASTGSGGSGDTGSRPSSPLQVERSGGSGSSAGSRGSCRLESSYSRGAGNPSEFGLPYQFGCGLGALQGHDSTGAGTASGQHVVQGSPVQLPPTDRPQRRSSFGSNAGRGAALQGGAPGGSGYVPRSLPLVSCGASFFGGGAAVPQQLPPGRMAFHRRSSSSSSIGSQTALTADAAAVAYQHAVAVGPHCPSSLNWCAEPYSVPAPQQLVVGQPYLPLQLPVKPQFVMCTASAAGRTQWSRQASDSQLAGDGSWPPQHMRCNSASWPLEQQHVALGYQAVPQLHHLALQYMQAGTAVARGGLGPGSAPASAMTSPVLGPNGSGYPTATPPPPPPLVLPVLDLQVPESSEDCPDLERFLQPATPQVAPPPTGMDDLTLADVWAWYEGPSTIGCEVATMGGLRGPATSYYLPYLSAVQLLVPADDAGVAAAVTAAAAAGEGPGSPAAPRLLCYPNGLDSWPERMRPLVQWAERANMRDRVPLHSRMADVCGEAGDAHPLMATRIADLHPLSWFAVAWYPLYRVPEAPLTARFLTFHTLASLWEAAAECDEKRRARQQGLAEAAAAELDAQRAASEAVAATPARPAPPPAAPAPAPAPRALAAARRSYKSMLESGLPAADVHGMPPQTATPTTVCSFPGSPTCSDAGTRSTLGGHARSRLAGSCTSGSATHGSACSTGGGSEAAPSSLADSTGSGSEGEATASPASPAASEVDDAPDPLPVPVAGLVWYAAGRDENWVETLVAAHLPPGLCPAPGARLPDGARVVGSWRGVAVLARPYPVAKGGPLGWEIQLEEMAQCAERLAGGVGLVALRPRPGAPPGTQWERAEGVSPEALGISCPDYHFFASHMQQ